MGGFEGICSNKIKKYLLPQEQYIRQILLQVPSPSKNENSRNTNPRNDRERKLYKVLFGHVVNASCETPMTPDIATTMRAIE